MIRPALASLLVLALAACGTPRPPAETPATITPGPARQPVRVVPPADEKRLEFWRDVHENKHQPPEGQDPAALVPELVAWLASPDPERRDKLAYEILAAWIHTDKRLPPEQLRTLSAQLQNKLAPGPAGETDAVFGRSLAALVLSTIVARHLAEPFLSPEELRGMIGSAAAYAESEHDLRGHVEGKGWAHATAHTADWLKFLARDPALGADDHVQILAAVKHLAVRRHGYLFAHGEDERLARPVVEVLRRNKLDAARVRAFLDAIAEPLGHPWGGGPPFDQALYAAQRSSRNLIFTLFVVLSFEKPASAASKVALDHLKKKIGG